LNFIPKKMTIKTTFFSLFFVLMVFNLSAQREKLPENFKVFLDADIGVFSYDETFHFEAAVGIGYRFKEEHSVGLEYRRNNRAGISNIYSMQGAGAFYKFQKGRILAKLAGGLVLDGTRSWDGADVYEYKSGGQYFSAGISYHFLKLLRAGFFYTSTGNQGFDYLIFEAPGSTQEFTFDRVEKVGYGVFGITIGATLPPR